MLGKNIVRKFVTLTTLAAVWCVFSMVALAAPVATTGELTVSGQVTVNGALDPTTANVTELAYVNGNIWQENSQGLWWSKVAPADARAPPFGTSTNPVTGGFYIYNTSAISPLSTWVD